MRGTSHDLIRLLDEPGGQATTPESIENIFSRVSPRKADPAAEDEAGDCASERCANYRQAIARSDGRCSEETRCSGQAVPSGEHPDMVSVRSDRPLLQWLTPVRSVPLSSYRLQLRLR